MVENQTTPPDQSTKVSTDGLGDASEGWKRPLMHRAVIELSSSEIRLDDPTAVEGLIEDIVSEFDFTLVSTDVTRFEPIGITAIGVLGESHISIHTWPEYGYAHIELLTCSPLPSPMELRERFPLSQDCLKVVRRGNP